MVHFDSLFPVNMIYSMIYSTETLVIFMKVT